jgi:hypothetical protein
MFANFDRISISKSYTSSASQQGLEYQTISKYVKVYNPNFPPPVSVSYQTILFAQKLLLRPLSSAIKMESFVLISQTIKFLPQKTFLQQLNDILWQGIS